MTSSFLTFGFAFNKNKSTLNQITLASGYTRPAMAGRAGTALRLYMQ